jgi:diguanylate cyclase (GGDEF)-like protein
MLSPHTAPPTHAPARVAFARGWSSTRFPTGDLTAYATPHLMRQTRRGVALLGLSMLAFLLLSALFAARTGLGAEYVRTYLVLAVLALRVAVSAQRISQLTALHLLGMVLLIVCGSALVLLARGSGRLPQLVLLDVAVLFLLVPLVPWGLREAVSTNAAIYVMFTSLGFVAGSRMGSVDWWTLQLLMVVAAVVTMILVARALALRKHDLTLRYHLEHAHRDMAVLALSDHLTGAWNRRHLAVEFERALASHLRRGKRSFFGVFDIDAFKPLNDTYGHAYGDAVLQRVARAFAERCGADECLVRLGGDEFALMLCGGDVPERVSAIVAALEADLSSDAAAPRALPTLSIGLIAIDAPLTLAQAYHQADALLYQAKRAGGACMRMSAASAT